jgi:hypothetical protein
LYRIVALFRNPIKYVEQFSTCSSSTWALVSRTALPLRPDAIPFSLKQTVISATMNDWPSDAWKCCGAGWRTLIDPLVELCQRNDVTVLQVKEKFGGLRFYVGEAPPAIHEAIRAAEKASYTMCENCGAPGRVRGGSWMRTLCDAHAPRA